VEYEVPQTDTAFVVDERLLRPFFESGMGDFVSIQDELELTFVWIFGFRLELDYYVDVFH